MRMTQKSVTRQYLLGISELPCQILMALYRFAMRCVALDLFCIKACNAGTWDKELHGCADGVEAK